MILDGGEEVGIGLESTIVDLTGDVPMILRPGYVTQKMLEEVANQVDVDKTILDANCHLRPKAPGMRYRHYAPKGDLTIIEGAQDAVKEAICEKSRQTTADGHRVGIIATDETMEAYRQKQQCGEYQKRWEPSGRSGGRAEAFTGFCGNSMMKIWTSCFRNLLRKAALDRQL